MGRALTLLVLLLLPGLAAANDWAALERPGAIALMRHALAPGTGDPDRFELEDCSTQRNLDARGRDQARRVGAALRDRSIVFDSVWTSQWCRSRDTAELLGLGDVTEVPSLNSFFAGRGERATQTAATLERLRAARGDRLMLVSHQVNISALTGSFARSGEIVVVEWRDDGLAVTGRILIDP
ncbi:histidine phosphatase family protein [Lutimaribacter sp. EGI FJ00015]|uniref:Histidine phosphatase family protein n=1 Tax=Lutimaribacter degradans TaxID=2945989 RepID=A0ACC5ZVU0_9RHOB|nr:histidine phosphatase family protein [Lutimaribacter sp. EGI FJ00013]MCM2562444.1 histidine phosphatase family protein [Lutimaribacter sp. EGI FJ00013]MCO0613601.1 histidine phosphatase family protein [Lutimaribacter sp. EGI FJ00015]MCO0636573.1 histidine phosphatase family protein [Lutimaribacter sp. EGI FJ00014]